MCALRALHTVDSKEDDMTEQRGGLLGLVVAIAIGVVLGSLVLSAAFWVFGLLVHLIVWLARLALIVGLAGAVLWLVDRWRSRRVLS
jgi:hypothetical protein